MRKLIAVLLMFFASYSLAKNTVTDYQSVFMPVYTHDGSLMIAIREFTLNEVPSFLLVNPETLETSIKAITQLNPQSPKNITGYYTYWSITSTRYFQLLNKYSAPPYPLENKGVTHADSQYNQSILTIDLCPATKPFEARFFNKLVQIAERDHKALPITISISGLWLINHAQEFQWLLTQQKQHKLNITWANHSFNHVYYQDLPMTDNFLLAPATNLQLEVLLTEKYLIEAGEVPSVFFRFPGLASNKHLIKKIKAYGLLPLGADAWIAKGEAITPGGIILVHGNSNEHVGITTLLPQLDTLEFIDIKQAI